MRNCLTIGILEGGGSLVGFDYEILLSDNFGIQVGAGIVGFGAGINIHLKPNIRSSFFTFQYWHQGIGNSHTQTIVGPAYVYRSKKWFTAQIGLGFPIERGPAYPFLKNQPPVILTYAIGGYIPL
ncbi:MAG: hypothetical protein IPL95_14440 [Saprospiraceae bacterium]|nr:hypothetical protein [Saprospiraceae bacterium]